MAAAIAATFRRRETAIPEEVPPALTPAFSADAGKKQQWRAFVDGLAVDPGELSIVVETLAAFLMPHASAAAVRT